MNIFSLMCGSVLVLCGLVGHISWVNNSSLGIFFTGCLSFALLLALSEPERPSV